MEEKENKELEKKKKKLRYVGVYDNIYEKIKDGEFEDRLPTEPELAKLMGVSRMTLRQALTLLREDGIIKNIQGKGNFIISNGVKWEKGLETFGHPVYDSLNDIIDEVEFQFRIEPSTDYTNKVLERKTPVIIFADRWYKYKGIAKAYTLSILPVETIKEREIDLNNSEELLKYLEKEIYKEARHSNLKLVYSESGNFSAIKYKISESNKCYLVTESLYSKNKYPEVHNKHYLPIENSHIEINRKI